MIGQLHKNFRKLFTTSALCTALLAPNAFAETISGQLIYADWFVLVKEENGTQTVLARSGLGPAGPRPVTVQFSINEKMVQFSVDKNKAHEHYLYIIAGSRPTDGLEPFLAASLSGSKTLTTGDGNIEFFKSNYTDINAPTNPVQIKEIIEGGMGGGNYEPAFPLIYGSAEKDLGTSTVPGIWAERQEDDGKAVVFRLPYSALIASTPPPPPPHSSTKTSAEIKAEALYNLKSIGIDYVKDIRALRADLAKQTKRADTTFALLKKRDSTIESLPTKFQLILGGLALLSLGGLFGFLMGRRGYRKSMLPKSQDLKLQQPPKEKQRQKPSFTVSVLKPEGDSFVPIHKQYPQDMINYDSTKGQLIVEASMGFVASGTSKMIPAKGNIPSTIAAVHKAYHAVGRVGLAQDGPAIGDDKSLGTAILIDQDRVMTNRHVFDWHYHRIDDPGDPVGVEFFGEKDSDATEFYELTLDDVIIIDEFDAVILTLAKSVPKTKRKPIKFAPNPPQDFDECEVFVIGYPAEPGEWNDDIEDALDGDETFGVKRYSKGTVYRHPQDYNREYGIETHTSGNYSDQGWLLAICHQASTLPGNSGSAVISQETGELIGIHFGSDDFDRHETLEPHPANVAHSGVFLSKSVTFITSGAFKNFVSKDI